jgi:Flp pilus assembly protein TadG
MDRLGWFMVTRSKRRWRDRGAAAVEFAFIVPGLVLLIFGSIEFGLAVQARTMVGNAAREGVRVASLTANGDTTSTAQVKTAVDTALGGVSGTHTTDVTCATPIGGPCTVGAKNNGNNVVTVKVTLNYTGITGMFDKLTNTTIVVSSYMRIEG